MTNDEIRFTIAELCGKPFCVHPVSKWQRCGTEGDLELYCSECKRYLHDMQVPNYPEDLNACAEFEALLDKPGHYFANGVPASLTLFDRYVDYLRDLFGCGVRATAPQRCEAFLRLHGKMEGLT